MTKNWRIIAPGKLERQLSDDLEQQEAYDRERARIERQYNRWWWKAIRGWDRFRGR